MENHNIMIGNIRKSSVWVDYPLITLEFNLIDKYDSIDDILIEKILMAIGVTSTDYLYYVGVGSTDYPHTLKVEFN